MDMPLCSLTLYLLLATPHALCTVMRLSLGLVLKFSRKIKEKEATKNRIQQSKLNEQFLKKKKKSYEQ